MFWATTAMRQRVSHLPPALLTPCGAGVVASKTKPSLTAGPMNQDSQRAGRVQPPESRNQNTELLALALFTQYLGQVVRPTKASVSSSVKWVQLCPPQVAAAAVRKEAKFPRLQAVAPRPGTTQDSPPAPQGEAQSCSRFRSCPRGWAIWNEGFVFFLAF